MDLSLSPSPQRPFSPQAQVARDILSSNVNFNRKRFDSSNAVYHRDPHDVLSFINGGVHLSKAVGFAIFVL